MYAVDVIRAGRFKRPKRFGIKAHETEDLPAEDVVEHKGLRVTTPLRTVVDLARVMKPQKLEIVILDAIARGLFTKEQLIARCQQERRVRTRSAAKLIQAVNRAGFEIHTESPLEREALQLLMDEGLKPEHGQVELWREQPRKFIGRYDQAWESLRLLIEVDSRRYHRALAQKERDDEKDREAAELAYAVVRIRKEHLKGEQRVNLLAHLGEKVSSAPARIAWAHACPASRLVPARPKRKQGRRAQRGNRQLPLLNEATFKGRQDSRSPSLH